MAQTTADNDDDHRAFNDSLSRTIMPLIIKTANDTLDIRINPHYEAQRAEDIRRMELAELAEARQGEAHALYMRNGKDDMVYRACLTAHLDILEAIQERTAVALERIAEVLSGESRTRT